MGESFELKRRVLPEGAVYDLTSIAEGVFEDNRKKGFWNDLALFRERLSNGTLKEMEELDHMIRLVKCEKIALIHSEVSELLEALRKPGPSEHLPHVTGEEEEIADIIIRILDYAGAFGFQLGSLVKAKLEFNRSRPYKHGKEM